MREKRPDWLQVCKRLCKYRIRYQHISLYQHVSTNQKRTKGSHLGRCTVSMKLFYLFDPLSMSLNPDVLVIYCVSGSGSSQQATSSLASSFLEFLQNLQGELHTTDGTKSSGRLRSLSILDVGCGWGEWLPAMLVKAIGEGKLDENLIYFGIDIAEKPIHSLQTRFRDFHFAATWMIFEVVSFFSRF